MPEVRIGGLYYPSFNSTNGVSLELYLSGCAREEKCAGCHNPELWDFNAGILMTLGEIAELVNEKAILDAVAILGGEPLHNPSLIPILNAINDKEIWLYTSYELDEIPEEIKQKCTFIKTGQYIESLRTYNCRLSSSNQKIYKKVGDRFDLYYDNGKFLPEMFSSSCVVREGGSNTGYSRDYI